MLKAAGALHDGSGEVLLVGLERLNVERLIEGRPILIKLDELGMQWKGELFIFFGEDRATLLAYMYENADIRGVEMKQTAARSQP